MATKYEYYDTGDNTASGFYGDSWVGQTFTPQEAHTITKVVLLWWREESPGIITVEIRPCDANHKPTDEILCSGTTDGDTLPEGSPYEWREITLGAGAALEADTEYAIVVHLGGDINNALWWRVESGSPTYDRGLYFYSTDGGVNWNTLGSIDTMFEEWGTPPVTGMRGLNPALVLVLG